MKACVNAFLLREISYEQFPATNHNAPWNGLSKGFD